METLIKTDKPILATSVEISEKGLIIVTSKGKYFVKWQDCSPLLEKATFAERAHWELSPSGYGIHWPLIDEDLSIGGLVSIGKLIL